LSGTTKKKKGLEVNPLGVCHSVCRFLHGFFLVTWNEDASVEINNCGPQELDPTTPSRPHSFSSL